jgi:DnaJ-class molecular chaperone
MKKNKRLTTIDKSEIQMCWKCEGRGWMNSPLTICSLCNGSGTFRESHYIYVDEVNKIAMDSDCGA